MNTSEYPGRAEKKTRKRVIGSSIHSDTAAIPRRSKPGPVTASASSVGKQRPVNGLPGVFDSNALSGLYRPERRPRCARCTTSTGSYQQRYGLATVGGLVRVANGSQVGHWRGAGEVAESRGTGWGGGPRAGRPGRGCGLEDAGAGRSAHHRRIIDWLTFKSVEG
jgi:hypothetical protein